MVFWSDFLRWCWCSVPSELCQWISGHGPHHCLYLWALVVDITTTCCKCWCVRGSSQEAYYLNCWALWSVRMLIHNHPHDININPYESLYHSISIHMNPFRSLQIHIDLSIYTIYLQIHKSHIVLGLIRSLIALCWFSLRPVFIDSTVLGLGSQCPSINDELKAPDGETNHWRGTYGVLSCLCSQI